MKLLRKTIRKVILQEAELRPMRRRELSQKQMWDEVARIITSVLQGIQNPIGQSRLGRHSAELWNDGPNPPRMDKSDEYGNPPMVWIRKGDMGDAFDTQSRLEGTTVLEVGSDLHGESFDVYAELEIRDIVTDNGQELYDILSKLVSELQ